MCSCSQELWTDVQPSVPVNRFGFVSWHSVLRIATGSMVTRSARDDANNRHIHLSFDATVHAALTDQTWHRHGK